MNWTCLIQTCRKYLIYKVNKANKHNLQFFCKIVGGKGKDYKFSLVKQVSLYGPTDKLIKEFIYI